MIVAPDAAAPIMDEEIFGPVLPVVTVDSIDSACAFLRDRPKPLALYLITSSRATKHQVLATTSSGGVFVNHVILHLGDPRLPFGGVGDSVYPPYTKRAEKILRRIV